jgi:predicted GNAT family acetyltransferase
VDVAVELLREALEPGRPYYLVTTPDLKEAVSPVVAMSEPHTSRVYEIDLSRFEYEVNVLVVAEEGIEGRPRFLVRSEDEVVAEAGLGWKSPHFAGVNVQATEAAQRRGLDRAVLSACTRWVVRSGLHPLVIADVKDRSTTRLVERVGYVDSGARVLAGDVTCCR